MTWKERTPKQRYRAAHAVWFEINHPVPFKDHGVPEPIWPSIKKANGLTSYIVNFINWQGGNVKRQNTVGRMIGKIVTTESGARFDDRRMIKSASGRGGSDAKGTYLAKSINLEVKIKPDKPSPYQLREQAKERGAGGIYEFVYSVEDFLEWHDSFVSSHPQRTMQL